MSLETTEHAAMLAGGGYIVLAPQLAELGNKLREAAGYGSEVEASATTRSADSERIALLEKEVAALHNDVTNFQREIADLRQQFAQFKKQFE